MSRDAGRAAKLDAFCRERIEEDGIELGSDDRIPGKRILLGERTPRASTMLLRSLRRDGAARILLTDIVEDDEHVSAGGLVVELPTEDAPRARVLARIARLADAMGFDADPDDGQTYAFAMLD